MNELIIYTEISPEFYVVFYNGKELYKISKKSNKLENIIKIFNLENAKILER